MYAEEIKRTEFCSAEDVSFLVLNPETKDVLKVEGDCPFEGEVWVMCRGDIATWTCPVCLTEHEEDTSYDVDAEIEMRLGK